MTAYCFLNATSNKEVKKQMKIKTIKYENRIYVPILDLAKYLNGTCKVDKVAKQVDVTLSKTKTSGVSAKLAPKKNQSISIKLNTYMIKYSGLNEYVDNLEYKDTVYVSLRYFAEMFDKKIECKANSDIELNDIPKVVIGSVNGASLFKREFDYFYSPNVKALESSAAGGDIEEQKKTLKTDIFDMMVYHKFVLQKAAKDKVEITAEDLYKINGENVYPLINSYGGMTEFRKILIEHNTYFHQVVLYIRDTYLRNKLINNYLNKIEASEDILLKYYEDNKANFAEPEKVRTKHILIKTVDDSGNAFSEELKGEAKKKVDDILIKVNSGEDFDSLMNTYSEDPGAKDYPEGYTFGRGEMVTEFEDMSFSLNVGDVSGIVETFYGYHIIKVMEKFPAKQLAYEEVKDQFKTYLDEEAKNQYYDKLIEQWKSESKIENKMK